MQRRKNQMPRLGGGEGDFRRFGIADLADHNHVWVLAQNGPQATGEREPHFFIHLYLVDSLEHVLNRILNGNDVQSARAEHIKSGVERRRSEEHTSELQSQSNLVCRLLLEKKKKKNNPKYR